jgi:hypothetical protein
LDGRRISGALPSTRRVIPFAVTGRLGDAVVTTYAFLRVPGDDDLTLALRPGAAQRVDELASVSFDMASLVALPRRATLEVGTDVAATGVRAEGRCAVAGSVVTYDADLRLNDVLRVGDLGLRLVFGQIGDRAAAGLRRVLGAQVA